MTMVQNDRAEEWRSDHPVLRWFVHHWIGFYAWLTEPMPFPRDRWYAWCPDDDRTE